MHPNEKIFESLVEMKNICQKRKENGETIVLTSGCFDLLHGGHLEYIYGASMLGCLIVGINSDAFVKKLKGDSRPIRNQDDRAFTMAGFFSVEHVVVFDCDYELIKAVRPDIYIVSATSHVRIEEDARRISLLNDIGTEIIEIGSKKTDSTSAIIKRAFNR